MGLIAEFGLRIWGTWCVVRVTYYVVRVLELGIWSFSGAWSLDAWGFGLRFNPSTTRKHDCIITPIQPYAVQPPVMKINHLVSVESRGGITALVDRRRDG